MGNLGWSSSLNPGTLSKSSTISHTVDRTVVGAQIPFVGAGVMMEAMILVASSSGWPYIGGQPLPGLCPPNQIKHIVDQDQLPWVYLCSISGIVVLIESSGMWFSKCTAYSG